ncbi:SPW repeat domain-containing protein [Paenibacillus roseipurpureus]|uniref:SPW repeat protein n=1 Tax=Paenibacillus roseopurpureus TaxID=2918901 RepID=A0AA96LMT9_9BACL|nr:SPW repeat protein [Paenibacillus sp. MBLB1832]WNR43436.1 SPW repeat protein [Paenibacillus sp. MBLB1832]
MYLRNCLSAIMGIWVLLNPWVFGFGDVTNALFGCAIIGSLQFVCSMLVLGKTGDHMWQNWACVVTGALSIVLPNVFQLGMLAFLSFIFFGFMTILVNYANIYPDSQ